jgi:hypothetical protein
MDDDPFGRADHAAVTGKSPDDVPWIRRPVSRLYLPITVRGIEVDGPTAAFDARGVEVRKDSRQKEVVQDNDPGMLIEEREHMPMVMRIAKLIENSIELIGTLPEPLDAPEPKG